MPAATARLATARWATVLAALAMALAACGGSDGTTGAAAVTAGPLSDAPHAALVASEPEPEPVGPEPPPAADTSPPPAVTRQAPAASTVTSPTVPPSTGPPSTGPAPTVSPPTTSPPPTTAPPPRYAPGQRINPSSAEVQAAMAALSARIPMFQPTEAQLRSFADAACASFDQGQTRAQVESTVRQAVGYVQGASLSAADAEFAVATVVGLRCPGYL